MSHSSTNIRSESIADSSIVLELGDTMEEEQALMLVPSIADSSKVLGDTMEEEQALMFVPSIADSSIVLGIQWRRSRL